MNVYVLVMTDREMRPRMDITTTEVFASLEAALAAMERDIANVSVDDIDNLTRSPEHCFAASRDFRFTWKVEIRKVQCVCSNSIKQFTI